jgi:hypothetical protein
LRGFRITIPVAISSKPSAVGIPTLCSPQGFYRIMFIVIIDKYHPRTATPFSCSKSGSHRMKWVCSKSGKAFIPVSGFDSDIPKQELVRVELTTISVEILTTVVSAFAKQMTFENYFNKSSALLYSTRTINQDQFHAVFCTLCTSIPAAAAA